MVKRLMREKFKDVFTGHGNLSDINLNWDCDDCGKRLNFSVTIDKKLTVEYEATCCKSLYVITPYHAAYNKYKEK